MIRYPRVIMEVLSPSTEATDRGRKFLYYRECPSVQEYVMVDSQSILIEVYRREEDGWKLHTFRAGDTVKLESLDLQFSVDTVYRGMKLNEERKNRRQR
ncbi:MAG: Uma2 family endonuclease [Ktedonobacteraceae bacterium]|nr:Uma2 family endonuclease [Ktedonobacteraceae bacterium]